MRVLSWKSAIFGVLKKRRSEAIVIIIVISSNLETGLVGASMYFISEIMFCFKRINKIEDWLLNLLWISTHYYSTYFLMKSVIV